MTARHNPIATVWSSWRRSGLSMTRPVCRLYLALYEGYTAPEIAEMLDAPVNTVYSWIARGKKTLKEALS